MRVGQESGLSVEATVVLNLLPEDGRELPVVRLSRDAGMLPSELVQVLDELHDAGLVLPGLARATVRRRRDDGRFVRRSSGP